MDAIKEFNQLNFSRFRRGDQPEFHLYFERFYGCLLLYGDSWNRNMVVTKEVVAHVLIAGWHQKRFFTEREQFIRWLYDYCGRCARATATAKDKSIQGINTLLQEIQPADYLSEVFDLNLFRITLAEALYLALEERNASVPQELRQEPRKLKPVLPLSKLKKIQVNVAGFGGPN